MDKISQSIGDKTTVNMERVKSIFLKHGIFIALVLICFIISTMTENFFTISNILNVVRQVSFNGILAIGMTFVIITGGIDLSVGAILALSGVVSASLVLEGKGVVPAGFAIFIGLLVGMLLGLFNGLIITKGKLAPFIVTMAVMTLARGASLVYSNGRPFTGLSSDFKQIGAGFILGIPIPIIIFVAVILLSHFILNYTKFGRYIYAVGGNEIAAKASGLNVNAIKTYVYMICGTLSGLVGIVLSSRINSGSPIWGIGYELDAIAAAVIGGTSLSGGIGTIYGTVVGALIIGVISNGLDIMNVSSYYQQLIKGLIILIAVLIDRKNK
ncbi:MAG: Ribose transporter permease protein [Bacilli bacterium]|jgi:ribose/xylose/arabinose/galactoside ABC-type transport system permease subunit|nr:Ribose transporter permease protein [Bacilli bacterium]